MHDSVRIAVTNAPVFFSVKEAWDWAESTAGAVRRAGSDLLVLPELFLPGYHDIRLNPDPEDIAAFRQKAEPIPGPATQRMAELSRALAIDIVFGLLEVKDGRWYNAAVWVGPHGVKAVYRKIHPYASETRYMSPGNSWTLLDTPWGRAGLLICRDKEFPEAARQLRLAGARWLGRADQESAEEAAFTGMEAALDIVDEEEGPG